MNLNLFTGGYYWGAWGVPSWHAAHLPPRWYFVPGSKWWWPSLVRAGLLPASLLGLGFLAAPLLAYGGLPGLLDPFTTVDGAGQVAAAQAQTESPEAFPGVAVADANPLAVPAQRPRATAAVRPGCKTGTASALSRGRGKNGELGRRNEARLEIGADAFSDEAVRGLLDDWIIPMIVEGMIKAVTGRRDPNDPIDMTG